jgi:hypothetical protein
MQAAKAAGEFCAWARRLRPKARRRSAHCPVQIQRAELPQRGNSDIPLFGCSGQPACYGVRRATTMETGLFEIEAEHLWKFGGAASSTSSRSTADWGS